MVMIIVSLGWLTTPALSSLLLRKTGTKEERDTWLVKQLKHLYLPILNFSLHHSRLVIIMAVLFTGGAIVTLPFIGRSFLPEFNEGTLTIGMVLIPGTALEESEKIGLMAETILLEHPAVKSTARRTGRTEMDQHSMGSHAHEIEVQLDPSKISKAEMLEDLRREMSIVPGTVITFGQPISHRIDHMLSGTRANIAVKIFGPDLYKLRSIAEEVKTEM
ncbi:efflux RND transporter permease subunit [bacterium]|nr:efflux RND transporter permease subunit [bacterium]